MNASLRDTIVVITLVAAVAILAYSSGLADTHLAFFVLYTAGLTWYRRRKRQKQTAFWTVVWEVRRARQAERPAMLAALQPREFRSAVAAVIEEDGVDEANGDIERFSFPNGLIRRYRRNYWISWSLAVAMLLLGSFVATETVWRIVAFVIAIPFGYGIWTNGRAEQLGQSILEVTPFRLTEILADGATRTLLWNNYLEMHNDSKHARVLVGGSNADEHSIAIDYRRMGFARLMELVMVYGKFERVDSSSPQE